MHGRDDDGCGDLLSRRRDHAVDTPVASNDARDRRVSADLRAERPGRGGNGCAEPAHAPTGESPRPELAVTDIADLVVRHHERGARRARSRPRADDATHGQDAEHLR